MCSPTPDHSNFNNISRARPITNVSEGSEAASAQYLQVVFRLRLQAMEDYRGLVGLAAWWTWMRQNCPQLRNHQRPGRRSQQGCRKGLRISFLHVQRQGRAETREYDQIFDLSAYSQMRGNSSIGKAARIQSHVDSVRGGTTRHLSIAADGISGN